MAGFFPDIASSYASDIDGLILLVGVIVGFWFFLTELILFVFIIKYRESKSPKSSYVTGKEAHLTRWINWPHVLILVCDVVLIVGAIRVWVMVKQTLPEEAQEVRVTAQQWGWTFQYPGEDGELDTPDDITTIDELYLQVDQEYIYNLESKDVLHSFSVPAFRLKQDAIPGRRIKGWFTPILEGNFDIQCAEICGLGHGMMAASLTVHNAEDHAAWLASHRTQTAALLPDKE